MSTDVKLKSYIEASFQGGKIKRRTKMASIKEFIVYCIEGRTIDFSGGGNQCRVIGDRVIGGFTRTKKSRLILRKLASCDAFLYMLFNPARQLLGWHK